jgi:phage protein D
MPSGDQRIGTAEWQLLLSGSPVDNGHVISFTVDKDFNQPDMAVVVLKNDDHAYSNDRSRIGAPFEIKIAEAGQSQKKTLFKGEVAGVEGNYKGGGESRVMIRAFCNQLHPKLAGKKSETFQDKTDKQIISQVLGGCDFKGPEIQHKHVYQDNMSDLDFARLRAARIGCFIWTDNGSIVCKRPELDKDSGIKFNVYDKGGEHRMKSFTPRMSSARIVKSVEVRGWNPETKKLIVKRVSAEPSPLGDKEASSAASEHAADETFTCDQPVWNEEEAKALAEARLQEHNLGYMSAEAEAVGNPAYTPGTVISIFVNSQAKDRFDGKYLVVGTTHKYTQGTRTSPEGGYTTVFRLSRNAEVG